MKEVGDSFLFANGLGAVTALGDQKLAKMQSLLGIVPRDVADHMKLLAIVNRRVAVKDPSVSPFCHVSFINADGRFSPISKTFTEGGESVPFEMALILGGLDLTEVARRGMESMEAFRAGLPAMPQPDAAQMNEETKRRD